MTFHESAICTFECIGVAAHPHVRASSSVVVLPSLREPTRRQREEVVARLLNLLQLALEVPEKWGYMVNLALFVLFFFRYFTIFFYFLT